MPWWLLMVGMMVPSAAPMILPYGDKVTKISGTLLILAGGGYLFV